MSQNAYLQGPPKGKRMVGLAVAMVFHVVLIYGLMHGLGRQVLEVIKQPLDIKMIEEVKLPPPPPPPPPPKDLPPPPPTAPPPPAYVPPPEVQVPTPPPAPSITAQVQPEPPKPVPQVIAPPAPKVEAPPPPPPPPPKPRLRSGINPVWKPPVQDLLSSYPRQARREGITGRVLLRLTINPGGDVIKVDIRDSQPKGVFDKAARDYVSRFKFEKGDDEFEVDQEIEFRLE